MNMCKHIRQASWTMDMPPVDKIDEVPDDLFFQDFLNLEVLSGLDRPVIDESAVEGFNNWSNDADGTISSTTCKSGPVARSKHCFHTVNKEQLYTAIKQRIPKGTQRNTSWGLSAW